MLYKNKDTGEILTREEMLRQFIEDYDGDDPTNSIGVDEYFDEIQEV